MLGHFNEFKKSIYDFANSQTSKVINLRALSKHLYDNEDTITKYCEEKSIDIDGEFKLTRSQLSKFIKIVIKVGEIELRAPRGSFKPNGIEVNGESVVIHNKEFAIALIQKLKD